MEKKYILMDEVIYETRLSNGLMVFIHPKPQFIQTFASLHVNFGGRDYQYKIDGLDYTLPKGTAHFLEHMLFENNGNLLSEKFILNNADINAFTARRLTSYYFSTKNNFTQLLLHLLDNFVDYDFSEKSIKKEANIIAQELSMNDDSDAVKAYKSLLRMMYDNGQIYQDIGGNKSSIKLIDKHVLKQATNHFYHPHNMRLLITGNVNPEKIIKELEKHPFTLKNWPNFNNIERNIDTVGKNIHIKRKVVKSLDTNIVEIGVKVPDYLFQNDPQKHFLLTDPFVEMAFNPSSKLYKVLKKKKLYNQSLSISPVFDGDYSFFNISIETNRSKLFINTIKDLLEEIPNIKFSDKIFKAFHRAEIGRTIKSFDDVKESHSIIETLLLSDVNVQDYFSMKKEITLDDFIPYQQIFAKENIYIVEYHKGT